MRNASVTRSSPRRRERDVKIDLARGIALLIIFIDHNAGMDHQAFGWLTAYTFGRFSFIDAADVFFFISGYVSGVIYSAVLVSQGFRACLRKALKRCLQLYVAEVILFLFCAVLILSAPIHDTSAPWSGYHRLREFPNDTLGATLTLRNPPSLFGLLPTYIFFIGLTPAILWLWKRHPLIVTALTVGVYVTTQCAPALRAYIYADVFNPFAWQLVFFGGALLGSAKNSESGWDWSPSSKVVAAALIALLSIALLRLAPSAKLGGMLHTQLLRQIVPLNIPFTGKQNVEPLRIVNLLLWVIVVVAVSPTRRLFRYQVARALIVCGQNSLVVFCASVFLNYIVLIYARAAGGGKALQLAWNAIGCGALYGTAVAWNWLKLRVPHFPKAGPAGYQVPVYFKRSAQYLGMLAYSIWHGINTLGGSGPDL